MEAINRLWYDLFGMMPVVERIKVAGLLIR